MRLGALHTLPLRHTARYLRSAFRHLLAAIAGYFASGNAFASWRHSTLSRVVQTGMSGDILLRMYHDATSISCSFLHATKEVPHANSMFTNDDDCTVGCFSDQHPKFHASIVHPHHNLLDYFITPLRSWDTFDDLLFCTIIYVDLIFRQFRLCANLQISFCFANFFT